MIGFHIVIHIIPLLSKVGAYLSDHPHFCPIGNSIETQVGINGAHRKLAIEGSGGGGWMKTSRVDLSGVSTADNQKSDTHTPKLTSAHKAIPTRLRAQPLGIDTS